MLTRPDQLDKQPEIEQTLRRFTGTKIRAITSSWGSEVALMCSRLVVSITRVSEPLDRIVSLG